MLIQFPAFFFNQITMLSQPDVSFLPDGESGILSFSDVSYQKDPSRFRLHAGAGLKERYTTGVQVRLQPGKWLINANYNYRREFRERSFYKLTSNASGSTEMDNNASARPNVHVADMLIGYNLSSHDYFSVYGLLQHMEYNRYGGIHTTKRNQADEIANQIIRNRYNNQLQKTYAAEASWKHRIKKEGLFTVRFNYNNFIYDEDNHYENEQPSTNKIVAQDNLDVNLKKNNLYLTAALSQPLNENLFLKAGYISRIQKDDYLASAENLNNGTWIANASKSTDFSFSRYINLLYASFEKKWGDVTVEAGFQAEHALQNTLSIGESSSEKNFLHFYPSVNIKYKMAGNTLLLAYQQRTNRPMSADLNPFTDRTDVTYIKKGNPDLKAEFIHQAELSNTIDRPNLSVVQSIYFRRKSNRIMDMASEINNETIWIRQNTGNSNTFGIEMEAQWKPVHVLTTGISIDLFRDEIDGQHIGYDSSKGMNCMLAKANLELKLTPSTRFQLDGLYLSDQLTAQGKIKKRYCVNTGLSQDIIKNKLKALLSVTNLFDSMEETTVIDTGMFKQTQIRNRDARVSWFTLTYSL